MSAAKTTGYLLLLTAISLIAFALFGAVYEARIGQAPGETPQTAGNGSAQSQLLTGTLSALDSAARAAERGRRAELTHALDAALRTLEIGAFAFDSPARSAWEAALKQAKEAKVALQNGAGERSLEHLRSASDKLKRVSTPVSTAVPSAASLKAFVGATLINAAGIRIGALTRVLADGKSVEITVGGVHDLFGFLDWGGQTLRLASPRLIYGPTQWPKPVMVVAPTLASDPATVSRQLGAPAQGAVRR